jgi:predicted transcriptional regulator
MTEPTGKPLIELTAEIVAAYLGNGAAAAGADIPRLIAEVHAALLRASVQSGETAPEPLKPAVPVKRSVTADYIVCLEDGKRFKSLKRHLRAQYGMSPEQYRDKWGLPADYPMVAPSYAAERSKLARKMGLGQQRRTAKK